MDPSSLSPQQLEALLRYASSRLNMTPEQLARTVQTGGLQALRAKLPPQKAAGLQALLGDGPQAEKWLKSPQVNRLLDDFIKRQKP